MITSKVSFPSSLNEQRGSASRTCKLVMVGGMAMSRSARLLLAAASLVVIMGCQQSNPVPAIENILLRDAAIPTLVPQGTANRSAVIAGKMAEIDTSALPSDFREAWNAHVAAWLEHAGNGGQSSPKIKSTFDKMNEVAKAHGAKVPESAPVSTEPVYPPATYALAVDCASRAKAVGFLLGENTPESLTKVTQTMLGRATHSAMVLRDHRSPDVVEDEILSSMSGAVSGGFESLIRPLMRDCRQFADPAEISAAAAVQRKKLEAQGQSQ